MAFAANKPARHSQRSRNPFHAGGEFRGYLVRTIATACQVARPPVRIRPTFTSAHGGFYFQAFSRSVSLPAAGYNYNSVWTPLLAGLSPARTAASFAAFYSITSVVEVESDYGPFAHALRTGAVGDAPEHEARKAERPLVRFTNFLYRGPFRRQFEQIAFIGYGKV